MPQVNRLSLLSQSGEVPSAAARLAEFERLVQEHERALLVFVFTMLPNWADTEEVMQRTRIVLWRKFSDFAPSTNFRQWALKVARYEVMNFRKTKGKDRHLFDDSLIDAVVEARSSLSEELDRRRALLDKCIAKLRASDRQIIRHCYGPKATTTKAAAAALKRPVNTLYKALNRIRRSLMLCVQQSH